MRLNRIWGKRMKKSIKRYLAFIMAFAMMATYSFGPQNINVFADDEEITAVAAEQQTTEAEKPARHRTTVEKLLLRRRRQVLKIQQRPQNLLMWKPRPRLNQKQKQQQRRRTAIRHSLSVRL